MQTNNHKESVENTIQNGKTLMIKSSATPKIFQENVCNLVEYWDKLCSRILERLEEMETCKEQWLCFTYELEEIIGKLAESEVEYSKSKTKQIFGEESIEDEIEKQKVWI